MYIFHFFWIAVSILSFSCGLAAHEGRPLYVEVTETTTNAYQLRWKIPPVMSEQDLPLIELTACDIIAGSLQPALVGQRQYSCPAPSMVSINYPGINPVLSTLVLFRNIEGHEHSSLTGPEVSLIELPKTKSFAETAGEYSLSGIDHILEGYDHLLFVLCLILLSGNFKRILITVTGFTLGHSVTLGMSALGGWSLPPTFVEPLIAFSILILAVEVAKGRKDTVAYRYPALIATGFGLLHGFGFGGALTEIGLPQGMQLTALAFFNIGVEIGQILFVIIAYSAYSAANEASKIVGTSFEVASLKPLVIYPAGIMAAYWTVERTIGIWA